MTTCCIASGLSIDLLSNLLTSAAAKKDIALLYWMGRGKDVTWPYKYTYVIHLIEGLPSSYKCTEVYCRICGKCMFYLH